MIRMMNSRGIPPCELVLVLALILNIVEILLILLFVDFILYFFSDAMRSPSIYQDKEKSLREVLQSEP